MGSILVGSLRRCLVAVGFGVLAAGSLIVFPGGVLLMITMWLVIHTVAVIRGRWGWLPLLTCAAVLYLKRVDWSQALILVMVAFVVAGGYRLIWGRPDRGERTRRGGVTGARYALAAVWLAWAIAAVDWYGTIHGRRGVLDGQRPVVCLGDSLTAYGYPEELAKRVSVPVVNLGVDGITTTDALELLPQIAACRPQAVVVELGGHDFLKKHGREVCRTNLERIIETCREMGAEVVLVEVPRGIVGDPFGGLERELARRNNLELVSDTTLRRFVLFGPYAPPGSWLPRSWHLSDDSLHPNERGNVLLAEEIREALVRVFGAEIGR